MHSDLCKKEEDIFNMTEIIELIFKERLQYLVFAGLSIGVIVLTGVGYFSNHLLFQRFLGNLNPLFVFFFIIFWGVILLSFLLSRGWFAIYKRENLAGLFSYSGLGAPFVIISILVDLKVGFPADMNILFPKSLLFYPAIGFLVEILFHVLPLTILLILMTTIFKNARCSSIFWICILIVALLEPSFQAILMASSNHFPLWAVTIVWLNIFLFNLSQLLIFRRYDFISMYSFRLVYYMVWHIVWGYLRLRILF